MDYRYGSHTVFQIEYHFVWVTKYRYKVLTGDVAERVRELVKQTCEAFEIRIVRGVVSKDHVHILVSSPPELAPSEMMRRIKGRTASKLFEGKRSGNPSFVGAMMLRTLHLGNQRDEVENGSTADGAVPGAREGVSGIGAEGQGVGRGERRADAFVGELVRAFATLAGTA